MADTAQRSTTDLAVTGGDRLRSLSLALRARRERRGSTAADRRPLRRTMVITGAIVAVLALAAIVAGGGAIARLGQARNTVVDRIDPALRSSQALAAALIDQESGVRGYSLTAREDFLAPYTLGRTQEQQASATLHDLAGAGADLVPDLAAALARAQTWRTDFAAPTITAVRATGRPASPVDPAHGKAEFDAIRVALGVLGDNLATAQVEAKAALRSAASALLTVFVVIAVGLVVLVVAIAAYLRRAVILPLSRLASQVRAVASGELTSQLSGGGSREVVGLAEDVEAMRQYIMGELETLQAVYRRLDTQARELARSNSDLEQFAYVASHDLQEPLRKVASFCQLLERRYGGQLDERADQYIGFAVDGAKRMQVLINDLLAFSRVGRGSDAMRELDLNEVLTRAVANLGPAIETPGARVGHDPLPTVLGEASLLTVVFQNLVGNAVKFRSADHPEIHVGTHRDGAEWVFSVHDNGIGIEAEYAEKIFVIFQRLHARDAYPGTGIGLAMCRKIVEYHGGRIWLDTDVAAGTTFCFTLPASPDRTD